MDRRHLRIFLVLICLVTLLLVVSARINTRPSTTDSPRESGALLDDPDDFVSPTPTPTVTPKPTPTPDPYPDKPDVDVTDWMYKLLNNTVVDTGAFYPNVGEIENGQYFDLRAIDALEAMVQAARDAGFDVYVSTAYRSYDAQRTVFFGRASIIHEQEGIDYAQAELKARKIVAYPGTSDHQTGLGIDIFDARETEMDAETAKDIPVLVWLKENCAQYGFVLRFPEEKKDITGWFEPWHFRYVGEEAAQFMMKHGLCLEEFIKLYYR